MEDIVKNLPSIIAFLLAILGSLGFITLLPNLKFKVNYNLIDTPKDFKNNSSDIKVDISNSGLIPIKGYILISRSIPSNKTTIQVDHNDSILELVLYKKGWRECNISKSSPESISLGKLRLVSKDEERYPRAHDLEAPPNNSLIDSDSIKDMISITFIPKNIFIRFIHIKKNISFKEEIIIFGLDKIISSGVNSAWIESINSKEPNVASHDSVE